MRQLQRFIQAHPVLSKLSSLRVSFFLSFFKLSHPDLDQPLKLIPSVSEVADSVYIEWVFSHADCILLQFNFCLVDLLVSSLAVLFDPLSELFVVDCRLILIIALPSELIWLVIFLKVKSVFNLLELLAGKREHVTSPLPLHVSLALVFFVVEYAACTNLLVHDGDRLESIGQNNVGVHCCYINVVDQWLHLYEGALVSQ